MAGDYVGNGTAERAENAAAAVDHGAENAADATDVAPTQRAKKRRKTSTPTCGRCFGSHATKDCSISCNEEDALKAAEKFASDPDGAAATLTKRMARWPGMKKRGG